MSKSLSHYVNIRRAVGVEFQGRYAGQKQRLAVHLLDHAYDFVTHYERKKEPIPYGQLEGYLKSKVDLTPKDLGLSGIFFWFILKLIIRWIIKKIREEHGV